MELLSITLRQIRTADPAYSFVERLFVSAFPEDERRDLVAQRHNVDCNPFFRCMLAEDGGQPVGFFTCWDFGAYCYGEHFATDPVCRNQGYGSRILPAVLAYIGKPLVFEVEMPDNEISRRRIGFYRRNGMHLWEGYDYVQPSYRPEGNTLPMLLMASDGLNLATDFSSVVRTIHREVYGVE